MVSAAVLWVVWQQSKIFTQQTTIQDAQVDIAANQAKIAAKQALLSQQQMIADHRPWIITVTVRDKPPDMKDRPGINDRYLVEVKNVGTGPALGVIVQAWTTYYAASLVMHYAAGSDITNCDKPWIVPPIAPLAPSDARLMPADHVTPPDEVNRTRLDGDPALWVFGRIDYTGTFNEHHATVFCRAIWNLGRNEYYGGCATDCAN